MVASGKASRASAAVAAAGCVAVCTVSTSFAVLPGAGGKPSHPSLRANSFAVPEDAGDFGLASTSAAMGGLALMASGLAASARRRSATSRAMAPKKTDGSIANFCGSTASPSTSEAKTSAQYTTQEILPAFAWLNTGVKTSDLQPTQLIAKTIAGNDVLVGKDENGKLFCVSNLCPHIGTPMSEGADVIGDVIVCPLHGSSFSTKTGELIDWCPSPPIIGPLTGLVIDKKNLKIFDVRTSFFGSDIEVQVDTNAKKAYEANYWKGLLDAQGKDDGTYY